MRKLFVLIFIAIVFSCNDKESEPLSNDYRDITSQLSVQDFENIKMLILDSGIYEPYFNKYPEQPIYSFDDFSATLLPEVGQLNITCDPKISDFNQLVIYDSDLQSKYIYFQIIRQGDMEKENIEIPDYSGLKENKVYLLKYSDYDIEQILIESEYYIEKMKEKLN
jgi:hypothetical protein